MQIQMQNEIKIILRSSQNIFISIILIIAFKAYWEFYSLSNLGNETECLTGLNFQYSLANINEGFICISDA